VPGMSVGGWLLLGLYVLVLAFVFGCGCGGGNRVCGLCEVEYFRGVRWGALRARGLV